ncbi:MAG: phage terminase family protein [Actinomycetota bacterium]|nr:phage terminase family protein [Actinomycetota bacterium]
MPREIVHADGHDRARSLGHLAVEWIERFCVHGPGDVIGEAVVLDDELAEITVNCYAVDEAGRRLYDSAFISRCKGRAKSEWAAFLVCFEAFGPCRFAGFAEGGETFRWRDFTYRYQPGEPMGRPVVSPFIRALATEEVQSGHVFGAAYYNLVEGPLAEGLPRDAAGITRVLLPGGGEIRPSTSASASKDGGRESFVVFDETHLYKLPELHRAYDTVRRNLAKRKAAEPWSLEISTMFLDGEESVAERSHALAQAIIEGKTSAPFLFDHRYAPPDLDFDNEDELRAGLIEALGPFAEHVDIDRKIAECYDLRNDESASRRYSLNIATAADTAWLTREEWESLATFDDEPMPTFAGAGVARRIR